MAHCPADNREMPAREQPPQDGFFYDEEAHWEFEPKPDVWEPYAVAESNELERLFSMDPCAVCEVQIGPLKWKYCIDFLERTQKNMKTKTSRKIRRVCHDGGDSDLERAVRESLASERSRRQAEAAIWNEEAEALLASQEDARVSCWADAASEKEEAQAPPATQADERVWVDDVDGELALAIEASKTSEQEAEQRRTKDEADLQRALQVSQQEVDFWSDLRRFARASQPPGSPDPEKAADEDASAHLEAERATNAELPADSSPSTPRSVSSFSEEGDWIVVENEDL